MEALDPTTQESNGIEQVLVPAADRPTLHFHRERAAGIPMCGDVANDYVRRDRDRAAELAEACGNCFGGER